jgi:hypothetical protein
VSRFRQSATRELETELSRVAEGLATVLDELREIPRGIHPTILARPEVVPEDEFGTLNTIPNFRQWTALQGRVLSRRVRALIRRPRT